MGARMISQKRRSRFARFLGAAILVGTIASQAGGMEVKANYLYNLSDFDGIVPYNYARVYADNSFGEVYVTHGDRVDIFNNRGMQIYDFLLDYPEVKDLLVTADGDMLALASKGVGNEIVRCNYRGEPQGVVTLTGIPPELAKVNYTTMKYRNGLIHFAALAARKLVVTDLNGAFVRGYDLGALLTGGMQKKEFADAIIGGFDVDVEGNIVVSLPILGLVFRVAPDGSFKQISRRGSGPGRFGIPADLAIDRFGNVFVCDKLRSVVLVFDKTGRFISEFGFRGLDPGNLIVPVAITIGDDDRAYVAQLMARGVNVYKLDYQ